MQADVESKLVDIIGQTFKLVAICKQNGEVIVGKQQPPSIYVVPSLVRDLSPSSFSPRMVSIGPLHRHDEHLQRYEVQKTTYLLNMFQRLGLVPEQTLQKCAEKVICSIERIKACYEGPTIYNDSELAKMMVIDACFILEFIASLSNLSSQSNLLIAPNKLITRSIIHDLLLIENQIPFFVIENIFDCTISASGMGASFTAHIETLVEYCYLFQGNRVVPRASSPDHILGFVHKYYQPVEPMPQVPTSSRKGHSAIELDRAGMNFKPNNEDPNWAMAMKLESNSPFFSWFRNDMTIPQSLSIRNFITIPRFSWFRRPTLRMPKVRFGDYSELILRNLIIYEQSPHVMRYVTSYVCAMDMLIDTPQDVALLVKSKVLSSYFGTNEEAANMINKLCTNIEFPEFYYYRQWEEMDAYYNSYWPHTIAGLKRTYFNNPWNIITLIAAFLLFGLTVTQTIFTIKAAYPTNVTNK